MGSVYAVYENSRDKTWQHYLVSSEVMFVVAEVCALFDLLFCAMEMLKREDGKEKPGKLGSFEVDFSW